MVIKEAEAEKLYRELIMLFTPWRNEETDLLGTFSSYQEHCRADSKVINKQMEQFAVSNKDFHEIQQDMNMVDDCHDSTAPCTQSIEQEDFTEGNHDMHRDLNENYNPVS